MTSPLTGYGDATFGTATYGGVAVDARPRWVVNVWEDTAGVTPTQLLLDPFDSFTAAPWATSGGASIVAGRTGNGAQLTGTSSASYTIPAPSESDTVTVGCAWRVSSLAANRSPIQLRSDAGATTHTSLVIAPDGTVSAVRGGTAGTVLTSSGPGVVAINTWYYLELQATLGDTAGAVTVRVNGVVVASATGVDTKFGGTKTVYDTVALVNITGSTSTYDDLYVKVGAGQSFYGDITIPPGPPSTPGTADWVDVSCDVRTIDVNAGRSSYVEAFTAATAQLQLYNITGRYSTWTPNSIWQGNDGYVTGVPIRIGMTQAGTVIWRFVGTTDTVNESWPQFIDAVADVTATDAFKLLARVELPPVTAVGANELTGARIGRYLDAAAYTGGRAVDVGVVPLQGTDMAGVVLESMRKIGESEWGWLYVNHDGAVVFRQRDAGTTDPRMATVQFTFTDTHTVPGACYGDATVMGADESTIVNVAQVTPPGGTLATFVDTASKAHFGPRTWTRTDLPIRDAADAVALATLVVGYYKSDDRHIAAIAVDAANHAEAWPAAMGCEITDRIRFIRTLPGGHQVDAELAVQGRADHLEASGVDCVPGVWTVTWSTSTALSLAAAGHWDIDGWDISKWGV